MNRYQTIESWASRLGYVVERTDCGYSWHAQGEPESETCGGASEAMEAILKRLRDEYGGEA